MVQCDVYNEDVVEQSCAALKFDAVVTSLCLEAACKTLDDFKLAIKKIAKLLVPGGYFIILTVLNESFYLVGGHKFFCLDVTEVDVVDALMGAGFKLLKKKNMLPPATGNYASDFPGLVVLLAQKD